MKISQVSRAAAAYNSGDYAAALEIYKQLGLRLGIEYFSVNILLCERRIARMLHSSNIGTGLAPIRTPSQLPLKSYITQTSLSSKRNPTEVTPPSKNDDVYILKGKSFSFEQTVNEGIEYSLSLTCVVQSGANEKGAVLDISFFDKSGKILRKPYQGMAKSNSFGSYIYIKTQELDSANPKVYNLCTPLGACRIVVELVAFDVKLGMTLIGKFSLVAAVDHIKASVPESKYLSSFEKLLDEAQAIPDSNGSEYFTKHDFRVGVIGDIYMYNFYKDVFATVHYLSPDNYQDILTCGLDIVIYTTCWKGINNEEWRGIKFRDKPQKALDEILAYVRANRLKSVFQTIEDPSNFEYFLPIAKKFDYIFTTDTDCIDRYKEELGHDRVYFGEYGVNPQLNNPIGSRRKIRNAAFFAGSYPKRYKERCDDMDIIFDSIFNAGGELLIADRNFGAEASDVVYPERYQSSVLPPIQHAVLQKMHKLFRYNLNFNSIKQSPSMCAMRVYELQAQGNGLISNYAKAVFNKFPGIRIIPFKQDLSFDFSRDETWEEYRQNTWTIREVLDKKTSYQVVATLLENIGLKGVKKENSTIAVICKKKTDSVISAFEMQAYSEKVLLEESELDNWEKIKRRYKIGYFCWFSSKNSYEKYYLNDLINGFKYTNCQYITKNGYFDADGTYITGSEHEYTSMCSGKAFSLFSERQIAPITLQAYDEHEKFELENGYSIDPFEMNFISFIQNSVATSHAYQLSVIVPVYNNGRFLLSKCMPSLQRNKLWAEMEILLIDDGSTDPETLHAVAYLAALYPNVRVKLNHDGGSGSASRPRNQGLDMASASLITFLDPDNEIAPGAYDLLMELFLNANENSSEPIVFVSGFHVKVAEDVKVIGRHTLARSSIIQDFKKNYFERGRFPVVATQSAVISKDFLDSSKIRFVERSAGQDTLFGWELIANAKCGIFCGDAYIVYYADRSDSITNEVNVKYFEKKLILEKGQKLFLESNGLLDLYVKNHFDQFMENWYLNKLKFVAEDGIDACMDILEKICILYGKCLNNYLQKGIDSEKT
jgi:glycosyltransferase involved in cell wall biosynthesis